MRIVLLPSAFFPSLGGVEELSKQLAQSLTKAGHQVLIVCERWPRTLQREETVGGIQVVRLPFRVPSGFIRPKLTYALSTLQIRSQLCSIIRDFGAQILHVQCVSSQSHYAMVAQRRMRIPLIVTLQGELSMDASGIYQRPGFAQSLMLRTLKSADAITACSKHTLTEAENFFIDRGGAPFANRSSVIYNGIDFTEFGRVEAFYHVKPYLFALGRHVPQKGFDVLLRALPHIPENYDLLLAGDGPCRRELEELAASMGIGGRVVFLGRIESETVRSVMKGAAMFVLPSRHEPFGIVNLEAMASGTPIIATAVGGVPEYIKDGVSAIVVAPEDYMAIADAVRSLLKNKEDAFKRAEIARARAENFDWRLIASLYLNVYDKIAHKSCSPH